MITTQRVVRKIATALRAMCTYSLAAWFALHAAHAFADCAAEAAANYIIHTDGTATHNLTGLRWKRCLDGQTWNGTTCTNDSPSGATSYSFVQAREHAEGHDFAGFTDWRMPSLQELQSITTTCQSPVDLDRPAINNVVFPPSVFVLWTGSPLADGSSNAWYVQFSGPGFVGSYDQSGPTQIRLVRVAQSLASLGYLTNGACGSAADTLTPSAPLANLCASGTASPVTGPASGKYQWLCAGQANLSNNYTGATVRCTAPQLNYTVTASPNPANAGGVLNCTPTAGGVAGATASVASGATATCTATPNAGFVTQSISSADCGSPPTAATAIGVNSYTTAAVSANCTVNAAFVTSPPVLLASSLASAIVGMPVTLSATMNASGVSGTINFRNVGGASVAACSAVALTSSGGSSSASCAFPSSAPGSFNLEAVYAPGNYVAATSSALTQRVRICDLDIDASGAVLASTDGMLILRRLLNPSGSLAIANSIEPQPQAQRASESAIVAWIDAQRNLGVNSPLDIDGNGVIDAATDGLLLLRALLGFTGNGVTDNALGSGTLSRGSWTTIHNHLVNICQLPL
jgi:Protein of unknown function (DUF1566)